MITVKVVLDTRSVKIDNTSPLKLRLLYNRKSNQISLGYSILSKDWDAKKERIKPSCKAVDNINRINAIILRKKQKTFDILSHLEAEGKLNTLTFKEIKVLLTNQHTDLMVLEFGEILIAEFKTANRFGNATAYYNMLCSIKEFQKGKDFLLKKITYSWLKRYEAWYLSKGNKLNGLAVHLKELRALYNQAIKRKLIEKDRYPFDEYKIKTEKTRKRAISEADIKKIRDFQSITERQQRSKDYFMIRLVATVSNNGLYILD